MPFNKRTRYNKAFTTTFSTAFARGQHQMRAERAPVRFIFRRIH